MLKTGKNPTEMENQDFSLHLSQSSSSELEVPEKGCSTNKANYSEAIKKVFKGYIRPTEFQWTSTDLETEPEKLEDP